MACGGHRTLLSLLMAPRPSVASRFLTPDRPVERLDWPLAPHMATGAAVPSGGTSRSNFLPDLSTYQIRKNRV